MVDGGSLVAKGVVVAVSGGVVVAVRGQGCAGCGRGGDKR